MVSVVKTTVASLCLGGVMAMFSPMLATTASAAELQRCASEGGICRLPYPAEVVYGTGGRNTSRFIDRPEVPCSNRVFDDPAPGKRKAALSLSVTVTTATVALIVGADQTVTMTGTGIGDLAPRKAGIATSMVVNVFAMA